MRLWLDLLGIGILGVLFGGKVFKTDIDDIMSEQKYTIQNQENVEITLNIPKEILSEAIYTSEGQSFSENEAIVYQTDTTSIYLEKVFLSNDRNKHLCFMFNLFYNLPKSGTALAPLVRTDNGYSNDGFGLVSRVLADDVTTYPDALFISGKGPSQLFTIAVSADACKKAEGTMKIDLFINQLTYYKK